jgi:hypothetical protein
MINSGREWDWMDKTNKYTKTKMSRILIILLIFICSCSTTKDLEDGIFKNGYSLNKFNTNLFDVTLNDIVIAHVTSIEWEYFKGKLVREVSVTTKNHLKDKDIIDMIKFLHSKYPDFKIEVNNDNTDKFYEH